VYIEVHNIVTSVTIRQSSQLTTPTPVNTVQITVHIHVYFERKIVRGIFGPTKENRTWRIKNNEKLDKLIKHENIVNYIKAQILSWFGHKKECLKPGQLRRYLNGIP
jgi:hypothetical protein